MKVKMFQLNITKVCYDYMPRHDKTNKMTVHPTKTQTSLSISPVWSESLLYAWKNLEFWATYWAYSKNSDQTGWMPRLIWVFAGHTITLLVLSYRSSYRKGKNKVACREIGVLLKTEVKVKFLLQFQCDITVILTFQSDKKNLIIWPKYNKIDAVKVDFQNKVKVIKFQFKYSSTVLHQITVPYNNP